MSLLEMDFDSEEVTIHGDNGATATIELNADDAKELADFFMMIHDELRGEVTDDTDTGAGLGSDGAGCNEGQDNRSGGGAVGCGLEGTFVDPRQLDLFQDLPQVGTQDNGTDGDNK